MFCSLNFLESCNHFFIRNLKSLRVLGNVNIKVYISFDDNIQQCLEQVVKLKKISKICYKAIFTFADNMKQRVMTFEI